MHITILSYSYEANLKNWEVTVCTRGIIRESISEKKIFGLKSKYEWKLVI